MYVQRFNKFLNKNNMKFWKLSVKLQGTITLYTCNEILNIHFNIVIIQALIHGIKKTHKKQTDPFWEQIQQKKLH